MRNGPLHLKKDCPSLSSVAVGAMRKGPPREKDCPSVRSGAFGAILRNLCQDFSELALDVEALDSLELLDSLDELESFEDVLSLAPPESLALESFAAESFLDDEPGSDEVELGPFVEDEEDRESVTYQPLPLNTMPTG